jgi:hypothetical protein
MKQAGGRQAASPGRRSMSERKTFLLRIDPTLWAELETWAQDELRSVNGQIEYLLKQSVQKRKGLRSQPPPPAISSDE